MTTGVTQQQPETLPPALQNLKGGTTMQGGTPTAQGYQGSSVLQNLLQPGSPSSGGTTFGSIDQPL